MICRPIALLLTLSFLALAAPSALGAGDCSRLPFWNATSVYWSGDEVARQGAGYRANWWTQGQDPVLHSGPWQVWTELFACGDVPILLAPTVVLSSPVAGAEYDVGDLVPLAATAADEDGSVQKVIFLVDDVIVGEDAVAPYDMDWPAEAAGSRVAEALAVDNDGLESDPSQVKFSVTTGDDPSLGGQRIVGYFPYYRGGEQSLQFDKLTDVIYAFVLPNADGSLQPVPDWAKFERLKTAARAAGVNVGIAIGGWNGGDDSAFEALAASVQTRAAFVDAVVGLVDAYGLDLVDLDWEYPDLGDSSANFAALVESLSAALRERGTLFTIAVAANGWHGDAVPESVFNDVDFVNIMAYDSGETHHSTYAFAEHALNYWIGRGLPRSKAVLGVPFYSRPNPQTYAALIQQDPANACRDDNGMTYWNGIPTIRDKAVLARDHAGGIMNWELGQDAVGPESLLTAKWEVMTSAAPSFDCSGLAEDDPAPADCDDYGSDDPVYPDWPRDDWKGDPSHAIAGDLMRYEDRVYEALWWTRSVPGSDASWKQVCP